MITEEEENLEALLSRGRQGLQVRPPVRAKALKFLNALEVVMSKTDFFDKNMSKAEPLTFNTFLKFENF